MESDSEEDEEQEEVVVVEVGQRPQSPQLQDKITGRQFEHMQVSQTWLLPKWTFLCLQKQSC